MKEYESISDINLNDLFEVSKIKINDESYILEQILCNDISSNDNMNDYIISLSDIGNFRYNEWSKEIKREIIISSEYGYKIWLDELDFISLSSRNFVIRDCNTYNIIGVARMTYHNNFLDNRSRDLVIFKDYNNDDEINQSSVVDLGRLIIQSEHRRKGIAQYFNRLRIHIAKLLNAKFIIVTASLGNSILLKKLGFNDINKIVYFDDRPNFPFHCLQLKL